MEQEGGLGIGVIDAKLSVGQTGLSVIYSDVVSSYDASYSPNVSACRGHATDRTRQHRTE